MTAFLMDTNIFLAMLGVGDKVEAFPALLPDLEGADRLCLSAISLYEVNQKIRIGKLDLAMQDDDTIRRIERRGIDVLPLSPAVLARAAALRWTHGGHDHRDPFDRMIAATALAGNLTIVSADSAFDALDIARLWT